MHYGIAPPVFWTRGYRSENGGLQVGVLVSRPGYVAFLPLAAPMHAAEQFVLGASLGQGPAVDTSRMEVPWQGRYALADWWQHGEGAFDSEVQRHAGLSQGVVVYVADGAIARTRIAGVEVVTVVSPRAPRLTLRFDHAPPPGTLQGFRAGRMPFDAKRMARSLALITAVALVFAVGGEAVSIRLGEGFAMWPVGLPAFIVVLSWALFVVRWLEHRRPSHG